MKEQTPPLYLWILVISVFITLQWGGFHFLETLFSAESTNMTLLPKHGQRTMAQFEVNKSYFLSLQEAYPEANHIVTIGSSLTNTNVACTDDFLSIQAAAAKPTVVSKFYSPGRPLEMMTRYGGLMETLLAHPPKVLLIEKDIMCYAFAFSKDSVGGADVLPRQTQSNSSFFARIDAAYLSVEDVLRHNRLRFLATIQSGNDTSAKPFSALPCEANRSTRNKIDSLRIGTRPRRVFSYRRNAFLYDGIRKLQKAGTEVVLLHHPRPYSLQEKYAQSPSAREIERLRKQYEEELGIVYWHCPIQFPFSYFMDQAHMNNKGRTRYSHWLLKKIHHHLNQN